MLFCGHDIYTGIFIVLYSLRCQSLLHLKLYKIQKERYKKEWTECQKIIDKHIQNAASAQASSPNVAAVAAAAAVGGGGGGANASNGTPSPAGSEGDVSVCSKSSGYTSAGELSANNYGVPTPPTNGFGGSNEVINFSVPSNVFKTHYQMGSHVSKSHDLWEEADIRINRGRGGCQGEHFVNKMIDYSVQYHQCYKVVFVGERVYTRIHQFVAHVHQLHFTRTTVLSNLAEIGVCIKV